MSDDELRIQSEPDDDEQEAPTRKRPHSPDDDEDQPEEQEQDNDGGDDDEDEKRSKKRRNKFIDDIAENEDDPDEPDEEQDEEGEGEGHDLADFVDDDAGADSEADAAEAPRLDKPGRRKRALDVSGEDQTMHMSLDQMREQQEAEAERERIEKKYGAADNDYDDDYDEEGANAASSGAILPSVRDPKLWLLKVRDVEKTNETLMQLMRKFRLREESPLDSDRLFITSAFTTPASKGYIYVEAHKKIHVLKAIDKMNQLSRYRVELIPIAEMVSAIKFRSSDAIVKPGQWVRIKGGLYKGDLALVIASMDQHTKITLKILPRIDLLQLEEKAQRRSGGGSAVDAPKQYSAKTRPRQALFSADEVQDHGGVITHKNEYLIFNNQRYRKGYLYKDFKIDHLILDDVHPMSDEIERFNQRDPNYSSDDDDVPTPQTADTVAGHISTQTATFALHERVIVCEGGMKNITGRVHSLGKSMLTIMPDKGQAITLPIEIDITQVRKYFRVGETVKIVQGVYKNETGMIASVNEEDDTLIVYNDMSQRHLKVNSQDVIESSEIATGRDSLGNYQLYDLVTLSGDTVGVITKVEYSAFRVLTSIGKEISVKLQEIRNKRFSKFATTSDCNMKPINKDDVVTCVIGSHAGQRGVVKHIYGKNVFVLPMATRVSASLFVVPGKNVRLLEDSAAPTSHAALVPQSPHAFNLAAGTTAAAAGSTPPKRGNMIMKDPIIGHTIIVTKGPYKGYKGVVIDVVDDQARIELRALFRKVNVKRSEVVEANLPATRSTSEIGAATPLIGGRTPAHEGLGSATPAHELGSMTPAWGGRTPSRTPSHAPYTPSRDVWNPTTPHHVQQERDPDEEEEDWQQSLNSAETLKTPVPQTPRTPLTSRNVAMEDEEEAVPSTPRTPANPHTPAAAAMDVDAAETTQLPIFFSTDFIGAHVYIDNNKETTGVITKVSSSYTLTIRLNDSGKSRRFEQSLDHEATRVKPVTPQVHQRARLLLDQGEQYTVSNTVGVIKNLVFDNAVFQIDSENQEEGAEPEIAIFKLNTLVRID